ncbi:MAG: hypothetical protein PHU88_10235 [candidate division Zixibacteria bacterium]|nr:hypothetical protein [candidate division Zixibacteria bacterium]MDD5427601.1 hypothetical protein [candidate division Zixibacteria bacterium]
MFVWCGVLFFLGILAFIDSIFNMGEVFRKVNSVMFMLISLGLLIRTTTKIKSQKIENYKNRIFSLEREVKALKEHHKQMIDF